jgi:hypothetical protein
MAHPSSYLATTQKPTQAHLMEAVQVAVNVHGGPGQHQQPRLHLIRQVIQMGLQQRAQNRLHPARQALQLLQGAERGRRGEARQG